MGIAHSTNKILNQPKYNTFELSEFPSTLKINIGSTKWLAHLITRSGIRCKKKNM